MSNLLPFRFTQSYHADTRVLVGPSAIATPCPRVLPGTVISPSPEVSGHRQVHEPLAPWEALVRLQRLGHRVFVGLISLLLVAGVLGLPEVAQAAPSPCPEVEFLGMHGVNEGAEGGTPDSGHWGATIDDLYSKFKKEIPASTTLTAEAVSYPKFVIDPNFPWNIGYIKGSTDNAASVLENEIFDFAIHCTSTRIIIAGYSQGAWAVDIALRALGKSPSQIIRFALRSVAGVFLMGDPAWPYRTETPDRAGLATRAGLGYKTEGDYLNNELSINRFGSMCLSFSDGTFDPICMSSAADLNPTDHTVWNRDRPVHGKYPSSGGTQIGADFLAKLALP
jgi:Cutinase